MAKCKNCRNFDRVITSDNEYICNWCEKIKDNPHEEIERECEHYVTMTNADRIRSMTDEELAKFLEAITCETHGWCDDCPSLEGNYCHGLNDESNSLVQERLEWLKLEVGCE